MDYIENISEVLKNCIGLSIIGNKIFFYYLHDETLKADLHLFGNKAITRLMEKINAEFYIQKLDGYSILYSRR